MGAPVEAVLLLGGNLGDLRSTFARATGLIAARVGPVLATSRDHWTEPWGFTDDRLFLNRALAVGTSLDPGTLMKECLAIERELGRIRDPKAGYAARTIDIDLLFFGDAVIDRPGLTVPHPRLHERMFALGPAADIVPALIHPVLKKSVLSLLNDLHQRSEPA
jgi:2-amino-4-hydroxy-6-hydroxymethyldihydropteridine diphosphokinase